MSICMYFVGVGGKQASSYVGRRIRNYFTPFVLQSLKFIDRIRVNGQWVRTIAKTNKHDTCFIIFGSYQTSKSANAPKQATIAKTTNRKASHLLIVFLDKTRKLCRCNTIFPCLTDLFDLLIWLLSFSNVWHRLSYDNILQRVSLISINQLAAAYTHLLFYFFY